MKIMLETTAWADNTPNHVYVFNDAMSKIIAYVRAGSRQVVRFRQPIDLDRRGRTFVDLDETVQDQTDSEVVEVKGSKGQTYYLSREGMGWVCTCPGFNFHGKCRHLKEIPTC